MKRSIPILAAGCAAALATVLTGCGGSAQGNNSSSSTDQVLKIGISQNGFSTYNPWGQGSGINQYIWSNGALYDSLTRLDGDGKVQPGLATSWKLDGKTVTLQLRDGVKFGDGTPVDATAVKANFDYASTHPNGAECNAYIQGVTTKVLSPTSVQLNLKTPVPGILQDFAQCAGFIANPKALANDASLKQTPDGSGPYTLDKAHTVGQTYTFVKRADYWDAKSFPFSKIVMTLYTAGTAADNAAKSGQIDLLQRLDPTDTASGLTAVSSKYPDQYNGWWVTDTKGQVVKALADPRVRQAMNYAIDRQAIVQGIFKGKADAAGSTPFNQAYAGYSADLATRYPYDVNKAKSLLQEAGYANGITINALTDSPNQKQAQAMAGYLRAVGINLNVQIHDSDFVTQLFSGNWPLVLGNYTLNPAQLQTLQGIAGPSGFFNPRHNTNPEFQVLFTKIANAPTPEAAEPLYTQLATTMADSGWWVAPAIVNTTMGVNQKVLNVTPTTGVPVPFLYNITPTN